jgi:hypothetical protein
VVQECENEVGTGGRSLFVCICTAVCFVDTKVPSRIDEHQEGSNCENQKISVI